MLDKVMAGISGCMNKNLSPEVKERALSIIKSRADTFYRNQKNKNKDELFTEAMNIMNEVVGEQIRTKKVVEKANDSRITKEFDNFEKTRLSVIKAAENEGVKEPNYTLYDYMLSRLSINPLGRGNVKGYETIRDGYLGGIKLEAPKFVQSLIELTNKKSDVLDYVKKVQEGTEDGFNELKRYVSKIADRLDDTEGVNKEAFIKGIDNLQNHNRTHIAGMTRGEFNKVIIENVDKKWLDEMREKAEMKNLGVDGESKLTDLLYDAIVGGKLENDLGFRRELLGVKFKDPEGWYNYHYRTGGGKVDMQTMGYNYLRNAVSEITLMSEFGNDPAKFLNKFKEVSIEGGYTKLEGAHLEAMVANALGRTESYGAMALKAQITDNMGTAAKTKAHLVNAGNWTVRQMPTIQSIISVSSLVASPITQFFSDPILAAMRASMRGRGAMNGIKAYYKTFFDIITSGSNEAEARRAVAQAGFIADSALSHIQSASKFDDFIDTSKIANVYGDKVLRANGFHRLTDTISIVQTMETVLSFSDNFNKSWDDLKDNPSFKRLLEDYLIDEADWEVLRNTNKDLQYQGESYRIIDTDVLEGKNRDVADKYKTLVISEKKAGSLIPTIHSRAYQNFGYSRGTAVRQTLDVLWQLKSFALSSMMYAFMPMWRQGALKTSGSAMLGISAFGLMLGAAKMNIDNLLYEGEFLDFDEMSDLDKKRTAGRWLVYGLPYTGIGGDILYRAGIENDLSSIFEGPTMQIANDMFGLSNALWDENYKVGYNTAKILGRIAPSHWGTRLGHGAGIVESVETLNANFDSGSPEDWLVKVLR